MREQRHVISHHDDPEKFRKLGIDVIIGTAKFVGAMEVDVDGRRLAASDIVIATGARTAIPPVEGLQESGFLDHVSFLEQDEIPASVVILGGGYIGIEFAQMLNRLGSKVTVVEMAEEIIAKEDREVITRLRGLLEHEGIAIHTGWAAKQVRREGALKQVTIATGEGASRTIAVEEVFVASGRRGNIETLALDVAGVKTERSFVTVDRFLRTSSPRIWACGDVHGGLQFTHAAAYDAVKLVRNLLFPGKSAVDYSNVPWALYTDPEVGHIGMTEEEATAKHGRDGVKTYMVEMADVDRAVVDRTTAGFVKFVCGTKGEILGAHALCANASTLIEEIVLARKKGMKIGELAQLVSPYPSLADAIQKAASLYYQNLSSSWLGGVAKKVASWSQ
jgi:pyruvate/2-oxoglutarate dehydrogenase complex dihydrolipoamide dehydrogenase (E3) component